MAQSRSTELKNLYNEKLQTLKLNLTLEYLDELFAMDNVLNLWQYDFLIDQCDNKSRTERQQATYEDILKRVARKLVLQEIKAKKKKQNELKKNKSENCEDKF